ncbi:membrane protein [Mycobacterium intracellulare]|uniref:Membrane protein n=4 Tax=Mycobacterium intracellulare TaxID=1767 RepID=A0A7R7MRY7_MYCIT|nr:membrane protein [Mycobacterium intracellulare]
MLQKIARVAIAAPRRIIAIGVLVFIAAAVFGVPVAKSLSPGGFQDPDSESARAIAVLTDKFGQSGQQMLILVTAPGGTNSEQARTVGTDLVHQLQGSPLVYNVSSPWTGAAPADLVSRDGKSGLIVVNLKGGENFVQNNAQTLSDQFVHDRDGVTVRAGGAAMQYAQINKQNQDDLLVMEMIALPLSFVVLIWVFGGLLAAALPMALGALAVVGSMSVLRLITFTTEVSIFALNLSTALGLALAIDYTLLIVSRYRDELAEGHDRDQALIRTMATSGRTVLFSAVTVALSMSATVAFPMYFLKSFAYAGVATVAFVATASIVITPAAIVLLGDRLDAFNVRRFLRRMLRRPEPAPKPVEQLFWYRSSKFVMRRWAPVGLAVVGLLLLLGLPFFSVKWGFPDDRVLPRSASAHQVGDRLRNDFADDSATSVPVVVPDASGLNPGDFDSYAAALSRVPDVAAVSAPGGTFTGGNRVGPPAGATGLAQGSAFLTVSSTAPLFSAANDAQLARLHDVPGPAGRAVEMGGVAQVNRDSVDAVTERLPLVLGLMAAITFVLLFLLTGSVLLPIKALACNFLSLTAAFGALVWIFQDGHLGALGTTPSGTLVANMPVLLFCIAFGLSMDYEVFLLSRIREYWLASPEAGPRRQRRERGPRRRPHRSGHHRGRVGDVDVVRRADRRARLVHADVRSGPGAGRLRRRHPGADGGRPGLHARDGPLELVGAPAPGVAARSVRDQRRRRPHAPPAHPRARRRGGARGAGAQYRLTSGLSRRRTLFWASSESEGSHTYDNGGRQSLLRARLAFRRQP